MSSGTTAVNGILMLQHCCCNIATAMLFICLIVSLHPNIVADERLFRVLKYNPIHPLHRLLPPERSTPYLTRTHAHNDEPPSKITSIDECNFVFDVLYKDCFWLLAFYTFSFSNPSILTVHCVQQRYVC